MLQRLGILINEDAELAREFADVAERDQVLRAAALEAALSLIATGEATWSTATFIELCDAIYRWLANGEIPRGG